MEGGAAGAWEINRRLLLLCRGKMRKASAEAAPVGMRGEKHFLDSERLGYQLDVNIPQNKIS